MGTYRIEAVTGTDANVYTNPYPTLKGKDRVLLPCGRCGGQGTVNYGSVEVELTDFNGTRIIDRFCFDCHGAGEYSILVSSARATARNRARRNAERTARLAETMAENARIEAERKAKEAAIIAERKAAATEVVEGRYTMTGVVLTLKDSYTNFGGRYQEVVKMTVKVTTDKGDYLVNGTVPGAIVDDVKRGSLISFTGTVTRSRDDASFGFFKRPTGAKLV